ncbi:AraC-like DNA-binding protein [Labrenzia sp. EL_208]|nr:AraC-like DNA-binding protein [Labrenzia sp. EL_132]MBG6231869.1 AraC-like DNA-binding protein [Labrenzia sp. EL_208]
MTATDQLTPSSPATMADPLGDVFHLLRLTGTFYCAPELREPWGIDVPDLAERMVLVAVTEGACVLFLEDETEIELRPGQLILLPHGRPVKLKSSRDVTATPLFDIPAKRHSPNYETMIFGGSGRLTRMICGVLRVDHAVAKRLIDLLPSKIFLDTFDQGASTWLHSTLRYLAEEAGDPRPGGEVVLTRLADILVVQAIRSWLEKSDGHEAGWIGALRHPKLGRALQAFHREPHITWTVARLARCAGMSRSAFSARFKEMTGEGAMQYVTRWRMQLAWTEFQDGEMSLGQVAAQLGYDSEAAFSRAFKRVTGHTPGSVRRVSR